MRRTASLVLIVLVAVLAACTAEPTKVRQADPLAPGPVPPTTLPGGWPGPDNTGVPPGIKLRKTKSIKVTIPGTVLDGLEVHGDIDVQADDVIVRNVAVHAPEGEWGIIQRAEYGGLVVEDSEVFGDGRKRTQSGILNMGGELTVRRVDVHTITDGIVTSQGVVEDSYIHNPAFYEGDHSDMIVSTGAPRPGSRLVIRRNTVINTLGQTGAISLFQDFSVPRDVYIINNLLAGGGYSLYGGGGKRGTATNIHVVANVFSRRVWPKGGYHGPVAYWDAGGAGNVWKDNKWEDGREVPSSGQ
ncbi:hypothetical protein [Thermoactinospora rubra]|uniref:hypothetical protein n=1 Tax=Thermoactinospora rubra TaxID=1088767 RepID=UPI0011804802|nr:hypothetical protein [Thermoactinospora rubra]